MQVRKWNEVYERLHTEGPALAGAASTTTAGRNVVDRTNERIEGDGPQLDVSNVANFATSASPVPVAAHGARRAGQLGRCRARARRMSGVLVGRRRGTGRVLVGLAAASLVIGGFATVGARGKSAQATISPANTVHAFAGAPVLTANVASSAPYAAIASTPSGGGYWIAAQDGGVFAFGSAGFFGSAGGQHLNQQIVGLASTPSGRGYWLVARDGGVFSFGDAKFFGSVGGRSINAPIVGIASAADGNGYWLVARDGGVFAFGDASFLGSIAGLPNHTDVTGIASTPTHHGYWLVSSDGGVFAFGDAVFSGSEAPEHVKDATGIAAGTQGYWVARRDGSVLGFDTGVIAAATPAVEAPGAATVGVAARAGGGYWTVQAQQPDLVDHMNPFLVCTRSHESSHTPPAYDNGYQAVNPSGTYRGAYQFSRSTWNNAALRAGRLDLVGVDPAQASIPDQDLLALDLYHWQGAGPWMGRCSGL
ncbi:MAG TPA: hypothetical protein VH914_21390 [Acidimicrobiia bacterium]|jgi:hypothetical protein|nr:hypothetical protein [Acidimicrobiia bacterium]